MSSKDEKILMGVDEAGRGCLAGPVVSASVVLYEHQIINGVNDSKLLTPKKRESLYGVIQNECLSFSIASIDNRVIDRKNILVSTLQSMRDSINDIAISVDEIIIDGPHKPIMHNQRDSITRGVIGGDKLFHCISAASIIAKVYRDKFMIELHQKYPQYNFQKNKGYPTKDHIQVIKKLGPSPYHRLSFKPELYHGERLQ
ncbi:MAG TPA: ribonuclease HII [Gammaproteobacteria bacterium]|nr:ribonuclease HII [Gammaproteobacteria bacterium]HJM09179.1 ribonuclease HII [Gammaproteobacteria bacterium]HJN01330.1 ribonuclease HII [Gammaproteobacteria bacterium]